MPSQDNGGSSRKKMPQSIQNGKYELVKNKLGAGCFGEVYKAKLETGQEFAVKVEDEQAAAPQLAHEHEILKICRQPEAQQGFAEPAWFGKENGYNWLVMELLGRSVEETVVLRGGKFKEITTVMIAQQVLHRIEYLHSKGIVHRDIKPENFMFGKGAKEHHIYLIDFGLSKRYYDRQHSLARSGLSLTGTARYASINAHKGHEQSRRDDLEAIGHMLMYFLRGALPWSGLEARTKPEKYKKIMEKKKATTLDVLCEGYQEAFKVYLDYARKLEFTERPDYDKIQGWFAAVRQKLGDPKDYEFEWKIETPQEPLKPRLHIAQPDDKVPATKQPAGRRHWFCFCSSKASDVRD